MLWQRERHPRRFPGQPSQDAQLGALRLGQQLRQRVRLKMSDPDIPFVHGKSSSVPGRVMLVVLQQPITAHDAG